MADLSLTSIVCHTPNPVAADVAGETVLMSLERSRCYGLGEIGSEIWTKLARRSGWRTWSKNLADATKLLRGLSSVMSSSCSPN